MTMLNPKQEAFVLAYVETGNLTVACKKAGYNVTSDASAASVGTRVLRNVKVQARLKEIYDKTASPKIMQQAEMREWLTSVIRGEISDRGGETTLVKDRLKAAELLGKMSGSFITKQQIDVQGALPVVIRDDL